MTSNAVNTAYDQALFEDNFPPGVERHFWFEARNRILDRTLRADQAVGLLPARPNILEVGCGTGVVVAALLARGHDISGVEVGRPSTLPGAQGRITPGMLAQELPAERRKRVDALLCLDVIEHIAEDVAFLRDTIAAFPNCRYALITVPARPEVWSTHDTHYGHYRRYTRGTLRGSLVAAGLQPHQTRYLFRSLYAAAALMTLTGRDRDPVLRAPKHPKLHGLLAAGLRLEDALLGGLPLPGLSLLATARVRSAPA